MTITHNLNIDLVNPGDLRRVHAVQGDHLSRQVNLFLTCENTPWIIPENAIAALRYRKPDGTGGRYDTMPDGTPCFHAEENILSVKLVPQMLTVSGCVNAQVEIFCNGAMIATFTFQVLVEEDPAAMATESENYFNWIQWSQGQLEDLLEKAKEEGFFTGATPNLQIGTVTSLPAGAAATAQIRGTAEDPLLDLGIPKGADPIVDDTLTKSGEAADAKVTGDLLAGKADLLQQGTYTGSLDTIGEGGLTLNSVVWVNENTEGIPYGKSGICKTWAAGSGTILQEIIFTNHTSCQRMYRNNTWNAWYWKNAPMTTGTEYLTTECWNGHPVYLRNISFGTLSTGRKALEVTELAGCVPIGARGYVNQSGNNFIAIPGIYGSTSETTSIVVLVNTTGATGYIQLFAGSGLSGKTAFVQIRYFKI